MPEQSDLSDSEPPSTKSSPLQRVLGWLRGLRSEKDQQRLRDTLEDYLDDTNAPLDERELGIATNERTMMSNILKLSELTAEDVAVPRVDIRALDVETDFDAILSDFQDHQHSRIPVFEDTLDNIVGFVHIKDLVAHLGQRNKSEQGNFGLRDMLHTPLIVSPAMQASMLLLRMRLNRVHLALVVDEYGGIDGLITIEDLVEQIVGEIEDEHDDDESPQLVENKGVWCADARVTIEDFEAVFGEVLTADERESDVDTLGGLVMSLAGSVPTRGQVLLHETSGLEFKITGADPRRVLSMDVKKSVKDTKKKSAKANKSNKTKKKG